MEKQVKGSIGDKTIMQKIKDWFDSKIKSNLKPYLFYLNGLKSLFSNGLASILLQFDCDSERPCKYRRVLKWPKVSFTPSQSMKENYLNLIDFNDLIDMVPGGELVKKIKDKLVSLANSGARQAIGFVVNRCLSSLACILNLILEVFNGNMNHEQCLKCYEENEKMLIYNENRNGVEENELNLKSYDFQKDLFSLSFQGVYQVVQVELRSEERRILPSTTLHYMLQLYNRVEFYLKKQSGQSQLEKHLIELSSLYEIKPLESGVDNSLWYRINTLVESLELDKLKWYMYHLIYSTQLDENKLELQNYIASLSGVAIIASNTFRLVQDLMPRVVPFIGRTQILKTISEEMKTKQIVVLAAYGGTGKSTLANEFGYKYAENADNNDRVSILVHCETRDKVYDDMKKMALRLKIDISNKEIAKKLFYHVRAELNELNQSFLFILDNAEKYEDIDAFLKEFSQFKSEKCKFLMTTRNKSILEKRDFENDQKCILTIDSFNLEEAKEYIHKYLDKIKNMSDAERENLISVVKYDDKILPLKLKLTVNYINDNLVDYECLNDCVEFIRTQSSARKEVEVESYLFKALYKTKSLSILAHCAYLDSDTISLNLMRDLFMPLKDALNKVSSVGMLEVDYDKSRIKMHRLVQAEMRSFIRNNPNELLEDSKDEWTILTNIIKHLNSSLTIVDYSVTNNGTKLSEKIDQDYAQVKAIVNFIDQKSMEESGISKNFKEKFRLNVDYLELKEKLGNYYIYFDVSNQFKALEIFMSFKDSLEEIHKNNDNEYVALSYFDLGKIYDYLSKYEESLKWYKNSYEMMKRLYNNKDHPNLAYSLNNIGGSYGKLGKYEESLKWYNKSYKMRQRLYNNKDHAHLAESLNSIGVSYGKLGKYEESLKWKKESYKMSKRLYNNRDHSLLALSLNNIGSSYERLGKYEESLKWLKKSYKMRRRLYNNKDHADLASSLNNIGVSYERLGKYEESLKWYNQSYEMKQRLYNNKDHDDLALSVNNIGASYYKLGKYEESLKWYNKSYEMMKRLYNNKDHADLASSLNNIGVSYDRLGKYEESLKWKKESYEMYQRLYNNKDHADLASSLNNIGVSYNRLGKYEESLKWFKEGYEMRQRLYNNKDHADLAESLNSIGISYDKLGKYEESLKWYNQSYEMRQRLYKNKDHAELAQSLDNICYSYYRLGKYDESKIYYNLCDEMKQRLLLGKFFKLTF
jgi:tetratricopeptide (TPR) repeat protein/KaiC/GvpD/RAD55 family RecA-like ATPase